MTVLLTTAEPELMAAAKDAADLVALASPFVSIGVAQQLAREATRSVATWSLLTRLDPFAVAGGYLSTDGLRLLLEAGVEVRNAPRLHAKVYLVDREFGIVGSANLTGSGLGGSPNANLELSHRLDPPQEWARPMRNSASGGTLPFGCLACTSTSSTNARGRSHAR